MLKRVIKLSILMVGLLTASGAWATTYYIDWSNGADTNGGISKSTPWKRAPGMYGCSNNCLAKRNAGGTPGDQFILKGGVTWPRAALSWDYYFGSGTQANPIYFGVDQTWYSGSSWSRPILDAEGGTPNASPEGITAMMRTYGSWMIVDNIEFKGLAQLTNSEPRILIAGTSSTSNMEVKNCYFHGWSHGGAATLDRLIVISTALVSEGSDMGTKIHDNVFDGSDTTQDMAMAYKGSAGHFYNNYVGYMTNGVVSGNARYFWGNTFDHIGNTASFDPTAHMNSIENMGGVSIIYNNYFINPSGGVTIWTENVDGQTDYVFNNVVVNDKNQGVQISNWSFATGTSTGIYVFNNTFHGMAGYSSGSRIAGPSYTSRPYMSFATIRNNHIIGDTPTVDFKRITTQTASNTTSMTNAQATTAGYVTTGTYPSYPPAGGATVATGMDLRTLAASIPSTTTSPAATAAMSDSTCGVKYDATNHRVIGPNKTPISRGTKWDVGAYQFSGSQPAPPKNFKIQP